MQKIIQRGFTLIELLVVIAIIGILAGIVLASLGSARSSAGDAGVRSNLDTIRTQAEVYATNNNNSYANMCTSDATVVAAIAAAKTAGGSQTATVTAYATTGGADKVTCHENGTSGWAVEAPLKATHTNFACVDSTGVTATTSGSTLAASDILCN